MRLPFIGRSGPPLLGWFGKLPAVGDYAGRGLPVALREAVYAWFADGMARLVERHGDQWQATYQLSPVWHFAMNPGVWDARALTGCVAPSIDRVGRCSPLAAMRSIEPELIAAHLPPLSDWSCKVEALLRRTIAEGMAVESVQVELDAALRAEGPLHASAGHACNEPHSTGDILAELGIGDGGSPYWFSWPDLPDRFAERSGRSFWWAEPSPAQPPRQVIHNGAPDAELFELLTAGWVRR